MNLLSQHIGDGAGSHQPLEVTQWTLGFFFVLAFLGFFAGVGLASMRVKQDTTDDYLVAGRGMHPALAALSAVSTWNSGYMFIGFIGFITNGIFCYLDWCHIHYRATGRMGLVVQVHTKEGNERGLRSLSSLVAKKRERPGKISRCSISVFPVDLCCCPANGWRKSFVMLGWPELVGILIGFVLVVAYCYAGGIRASI